MPLRLFRLRNVATANVVGVLWAAAMFAWFFLSALYLQLVLGYSPLEVGLAFLPANLIMAAFSLGLSAKLVMRFGIRRPLAVGHAARRGAGSLLFARAPVDGSFLVDVLPAMILLGIGAGMAFNPVLLAAMSDVEPQESGLASGVVNTAFMMGGALGLAVLASLAASRTRQPAARRRGRRSRRSNGGYHLAFVVGALFALAAAFGATLLPDGRSHERGVRRPARDRRLRLTGGARATIRRVLLRLVVALALVSALAGCGGGGGGTSSTSGLRASTATTVPAGGAGRLAAPPGERARHGALVLHRPVQDHEGPFTCRSRAPGRRSAPTVSTASSAPATTTACASSASSRASSSSSGSTRSPPSPGPGRTRTSRTIR